MKPLKYILIVFLLFAFTGLESCGPVIISSRPSHPAPPWFYPSRVVNVRYVFFPDHMIYYDLTIRSYIYLDNGIWITVATLPPRFNTINFRRAKQVRINNYFGDNIRVYHKTRATTKGRRTSTNRTTTKSKRRG
jgi:hypothetical protein